MKGEGRRFQQSWEEEYFRSQIHNDVLWLICQKRSAFAERIIVHVIARHATQKNIIIK